MANISNSFGDITIKTKSMKDLNILLDYFDTISSYNYYTYVHKDYAEIEEKDDEVIFKSTFVGCGKWNYQNNLDMLFCESKFSDKLERLNSFNIFFDYIDYETGCEFIVDQTYKIEKTKDNELVRCLISEDYYDYNCKNLREICGEEEAYDFSNRYLTEYVTEIVDALFPSSKITNENEKLYERLKEKAIEKAIAMRNKEFSKIEPNNCFISEDYIGISYEIERLVNEYKGGMN